MRKISILWQKPSYLRAPLEYGSITQQTSIQMRQKRSIGRSNGCMRVARFMRILFACHSLSYIVLFTHKPEPRQIASPSLLLCLLLSLTHTYTLSSTPKAPWELALVETLNTRKQNILFEPRQTDTTLQLRSLMKRTPGLETEFHQINTWHSEDAPFRGYSVSREVIALCLWNTKPMNNSHKSETFHRLHDASAFSMNCAGLVKSG